MLQLLQIKGFNSLINTVSINNKGHFNEALLDFPLKINLVYWLTYTKIFLYV